MDPITIAPLAISTWKVLAPWVKKLAGKMIEKASDELPEAVGKVWDTVKEKMEESPATHTLPQELAQAPEDATLQGAFQYQLKKLLENDEAFAKQLEQLVKEAGKPSQSVSVTVKGSGAAAVGIGAKAAGKGGVIVEGDVHGNIITGSKNKISTKKVK